MKGKRLASFHNRLAPKSSLHRLVYFKLCNSQQFKLPFKGFNHLKATKKAITRPCIQSMREVGEKTSLQSGLPFISQLLHPSPSSHPPSATQLPQPAPTNTANPVPVTHTAQGTVSLILFSFSLSFGDGVSLCNRPDCPGTH